MLVFLCGIYLNTLFTTAQQVRQQLTELGYDSATIPDAVRAPQASGPPPTPRARSHLDCSPRIRQVLREFLKEFEEKMELGEEPALDASQLSYPSALTAAEAPRKAPPAKSARGASASATMSSARGQKSVKPSAAAPPRKAPIPPAARTSRSPNAATAVPKVPPIIPSLPLPAHGLHDLDDGDAPLDVMDAENEPPLDDDDEPVQWQAAARPTSARPAARPTASLSASRVGGSARSTPRMGHGVPSSFPMGPGLSSMSGVIISNSIVASPRRAKCDPVSAHAKHAAAWKSNSFLNLGTKRHGPPAASPPPPPETMKAARRRVNTYVVPTSKRRDDLVWETRQRMRMQDSDAGGRTKTGGPKRMVPNRFVPATEKRRDDLRWAVRTEMAWMH